MATPINGTNSDSSAVGHDETSIQSLEAPQNPGSYRGESITEHPASQESSDVVLDPATGSVPPFTTTDVSQYTSQGYSGSLPVLLGEDSGGLACPVEKAEDICGQVPSCRGCSKTQLTGVRSHVREHHRPDLRYHQRCHKYFNGDVELHRHMIHCRVNIPMRRNRMAKETGWFLLYLFLSPNTPLPPSAYNPQNQNFNSDFDFNPED